MRCSIDWTQEPQVIPSTPRESEHSLTFCVMIATEKGNKGGKIYCSTHNGKYSTLKQGQTGEASHSLGE